MYAFRNIVRRNININRFASTLVIAEHDGKALTAGTLSTINAASKLGGEISVLVVGKDVTQAAAHASKVSNVTKVLTAQNDAFANLSAEDAAEVVKVVAPGFSHILAPASNNSKNFLPRAAALLDVSPVTDVISIEDESTFKRPVYAGNAIATVKSNSPTKILLIRTTAFDKAAETGSGAPVEAVAAAASVAKSTKSKFVSESVSKSDRPDLNNARVVVSGGRGLKSGENFALLEKLADKLGGAVGASRAAVDAGFVPNEYQIGQTGKVVAPELYIAVGISGAIQHLSGMKDSKTIVAINKDKEAPIFQVADYGLVEDLFKAVPELESKL